MLFALKVAMRLATGRDFRWSLYSIRLNISRTNRLAEGFALVGHLVKVPVSCRNRSNCLQGQYTVRVFDIKGNGQFIDF